MDNQTKLIISTVDSVILYPIFVLLLVYAFTLIVDHVDYEFIDEIFHITQCQKYCSHIFNDWDPKITTPPGLYYLGFLYSQVINLFDPINSCGLNQLRSLNYIGGVWLLPMVLKLSDYPAYQFPISNLISFPLLAIYYCLFYTDVWSTIFIILSLVAGLNDYINISAILGLISITFRQTNVVWNALILVLILDNKCKQRYAGNIFNDIKLFIITFCQNWKALIPFILNLILFAIFLVYNKGITFGDKENHVAGLHLAQLFYCSTFMCLFSLPIWVSINFFKKYLISNFGSPLRILKLVFGYVIIAAIIDNYTITHPFLLADNRHYIFYIWKRIIDRTPYSRYMLTPIYHFSIYTITKLINGKRASKYSFSWLSSVAFIGCVCLTIIPSPLFEPRYYIIPFLIWRIMVEPTSDPILPLLIKNNEAIRLFLEFVYFNIINVAVFYIFINYTFEWPNEPGIIQRIIW